jgi:hypothetical protein
LLRLVFSVFFLFSHFIIYKKIILDTYRISVSTPLELLSTTRQNDTDIVIIGYISDIVLSAWNDIPCIYWIKNYLTNHSNILNWEQFFNILWTVFVNVIFGFFFFLTLLGLLVFLNTSSSPSRPNDHGS